jgi:hypothetical protein
MRFTLLHVWQIASSLSIAHAAPNSDTDRHGNTKHTVITRDVAIIGGGSSGTYAAIQLKDQGKSVVVVEQSDHLGGHAHTKYFENGKHIDYGVIGIFNDEVSRNYFARLGAGYGPLLPALQTDYVDFKTGQKLAANASGATGIEAIIRFSKLIAQYDFLNEGVYKLPNPVPEELLQPFGDFVEKNDLSGALSIIFTFAAGAGDILKTPLLYVLQLFGTAHVNALLSGYITPTEGFTKLYKSAATIIGPENILYHTTAVKTVRPSKCGVTITVRNHKTGKKTQIKARKLLIAIPPLRDAMAPFDLDATEKRLFDKWQWLSYYASIVKNTGLPDGRDYVNLDPTKQYNLPTSPFQWALQWLDVPGHLASKLVTDAKFTEKKAKDLILSDARRLQKSYPGSTGRPTIVAFEDHTPTTLTVSVRDVRNGFFDKIYSLQGRRNTFYTGRALCSDYSSLLWAYTNTVLDQMFP